MKVLFVHDHILYHFKGCFYSPGGLKANVWDRYLNTGLVEGITVVSRGVETKSSRVGLIKSSAPNVEFDPFYQIKGGVDYFYYASAIKKKLRYNIEKVDVVIIRAPSFFGGAAYKICKALGKPYITEVVGCAWDSHWNYGNFAGKLLAPYNFYLTKRLVKGSSACLYVTEAFLQKKYPTNAVLETYASNVHIPEPDNQALEKRLEKLSDGLGDSFLKIGMLANISVKYKGHSVAIEAISRLIKRLPHIRVKLLLAGGGSPDYVNGLIEKYQVHDQVELLGQLSSGKEVFSFLDDLDLFLQPSLLEGLPRAVIEAMSRGCPVLASSVGGIPELIDSEFLHIRGDAEKLCRDLEKTLTDNKRRIIMARKNFERSKNYTDNLLSKRRVDFYNKAFYNVFH